MKSGQRVSRTVLVQSALGLVERKLQYVGWVVAISKAYPRGICAMRTALLELACARRLLANVETLSRPTTSGRGQKPAKPTRQVLAVT